MTLGALIAVGADFDTLKTELKKLPIGDEFALVMNRGTKSGISGVDIDVHVHHSHHDHDTEGHHHHHHRNLDDCLKIINAAGFSVNVTNNATAVFRLLAEAEASVHGTTVDEIHFHEVGAVDAILDITGACICLELLGVEKIFCSPMPTFHGFVDCAHGRLPLPAPAVAELLSGVPWRSLDIEGELVTPTGAAIVKALADDFGQMPEMTYDAVGYGFGKKDFGIPNVLRAYIGEISSGQNVSDSVSVVETNIDDMNPQFYDDVIKLLLASGALDVFLTPIQMKKGRPATKLTVICRPEDSDNLSDLVLKHTTSIGVRIRSESRICLERSLESVRTQYGTISVKLSKKNGKVYNIKPEYSDCQQAAESANTPVKLVYEAATTAANAAFQDPCK